MTQETGLIDRSSWQSMKTAPKDGTEVEILNGMGDLELAEYHRGEWWTFEGESGPGWHTRNPTHWRPKQ